MITEGAFVVKAIIFSDFLREYAKLGSLGTRPTTFTYKLWRSSFAKIKKKVF
jgi:hypothetical protein